MGNKISEFITNHSNERAIIVLKGYSVEKYGGEKIKISELMSNKIKRLMTLSQYETPPVIAFDEFLAMSELFIMQYSKIYIINNPVYHLLYPIDVIIDDNIYDLLLRHFDEEETSEKVSSAEYDLIKEYLNIYGKIVQTAKSGHACYFNIENVSNHQDNITNIILEMTEDSSGKESDDLAEPIQIGDDLSYFDLVTELYTSVKKFSLTWQNNYLDQDSISKWTKTLQTVFPTRVFLSKSEKEPSEIIKNPEVNSLLEKLWGYKKFRNIKVYDMDALKDKKKQIDVISQEKIISDIIEQAEHAVRNEAFQDLFVTAPTGAGKSLMFQLPAIYLAEKYNLVTLVITPLIGLMEDQVRALKNKGYTGAETINSDISPVTRQKILDDLSRGDVSLLYLSPESLLSKSDIEQLIGTRKIGMLVVDEAHIVTTWGKQFRPDYWFLGDHVQKLRRAQVKRENDPSPFVIATFTATAIYEGKEDMYHETVNSLHLIDPITYLGFVKRENIEIDVSEMELKKAKAEYEFDKFDDLLSIMDCALMRNQKVLIYFPTVALINRFHAYCQSKNMSKNLAVYNGQMLAEEKEDNMHAFHDGTKKIMAATKAFGMGIDIPDIDIVAHFAPTGNVCDYMQEIGRAARDSRQGHAIYHHMSNDFQHINRFHGLSTIRKYQLIEVQKKILEMFESYRLKPSNGSLTKKRNEMLVDTESFSYIFVGSYVDENDLQAKVKTAMLLIQKDYEKRQGFSPFVMRPIPLFAHGFFVIPSAEQEKLNNKYPGTIKLKEFKQNICDVNLQIIWERDYNTKMSFPKFKYLLYSGSADLEFNKKWHFTPAMSVDVEFGADETNYYFNAITVLRRLINESVYSGKYVSLDHITSELQKSLSISKFRAESMANVFIAAAEKYQQDYSRSLYGKIMTVRTTQEESKSYSFSSAVQGFFSWIDDNRKSIVRNSAEGKLFVVNSQNSTKCSEIITVLGLLEAFGALRFRSLGGSNSQLYLYVNETKNLQIVRNRPEMYKNQLLDLINDRHRESVATMTYLFQNGLSSSEIWDYLENYFLGLTDCFIQEPEPAYDPTIRLQIGEQISDYGFDGWSDIANNIFPELVVLSEFDDLQIPMPDYLGSKIIVNNEILDASLLWEEDKIAITIENIGQYPYKDILENDGWKVINQNCIDEEFKDLFIRRL